MKCASRIVGSLGVFVFLLAIVLRLMVGPNLNLFGISTSPSHLVLGANSLLLLALLLRTQEVPVQK